MKNKLAKATEIILFVFCLSNIMLGCKEESYKLDEHDRLKYYEENIVFSTTTVSNSDQENAYLYTTITVPSNVKILNYGHCWVTSNRDPTVNDGRTAFGSTNLKTLTITSQISNYSYWSKYYVRAYIQTENGIVYDETGYFN
jgi:hypothetical protein